MRIYNPELYPASSPLGAHTREPSIATRGKSIMPWYRLTLRMDFRTSLVRSLPVIRMVSDPIFASAVRWNVRKGQHSLSAMMRSAPSASSVLTWLPVATVLSLKPPKTTSNEITTTNCKIPIIGCRDRAEEEIPQDYGCSRQIRSRKSQSRTRNQEEGVPPSRKSWRWQSVVSGQPIGLPTHQ